VCCCDQDDGRSDEGAAWGLVRRVCVRLWSEWRSAWRWWWHLARVREAARGRWTESSEENVRGRPWAVTARAGSSERAAKMMIDEWTRVKKQDKWELRRRFGSLDVGKALDLRDLTDGSSQGCMFHVPQDRKRVGGRRMDSRGRRWADRQEHASIRWREPAAGMLLSASNKMKRPAIIGRSTSA